MSNFVKIIFDLFMKKLTLLCFAIIISLTLSAEIQPEMLEAARQGNDVAQCNLGIEYYQEKNYTEAFKWFSKSAKAGNAEARYNLGICYEMGHGTKPDTLEAVICYRSAAESGLDKAQYMLAGCYKDGIGLRKNYEEAQEWYEKAAAQNYGPAQYELAQLTMPFSPERFNLLKQAFENNIKKATFELGQCYFEGTGVDKDEIYGLALMKRAMENNDTRAMVYLGKLYKDGTYVTRNPEKAFQLFTEASKAGDYDGSFWMGYCWEFGIGCQKNEEDAYLLYYQISQLGQKDASQRLKERDLRDREEERRKVEAEKQKKEEEEKNYQAKRRTIITSLANKLSRQSFSKGTKYEYEAANYKTYKEKTTSYISFYVSPLITINEYYAVMELPFPDYNGNTPIKVTQIEAKNFCKKLDRLISNSFRPHLPSTNANIALTAYLHTNNTYEWMHADGYYYYFSYGKAIYRHIRLDAYFRIECDTNSWSLNF